MELNIHKKTTKGWQSERFCKFPQTLILQLERKSDIKHIQILSHQAKISRKIEIFVGKGPQQIDQDEIDWQQNQIKWQQLGYLNLNNNERSQWRVRELTSVYINCQGNYLKFLLNQGHVNSLNLYNQVGVVALNVLGSTIEKNPVDDLQFDMEFDETTAAQIREFTKAKQKAVAIEDFDEAKRLKLAIEHLKMAGSKLAALERQKKQAVLKEDFDTAKRVKYEIESIRTQMTGNPRRGAEMKVRALSRTADLVDQNMGMEQPWQQPSGHAHPYHPQQMQQPRQQRWQQPQHHPIKQYNPNQAVVHNNDRNWRSGINNNSYNPGWPSADGDDGSPPRREAGGPGRARLPAAGYHISGLRNNPQHDSPKEPVDARKHQSFQDDDGERQPRPIKSREIRKHPVAPFDEPIRPKGSPGSLDESNPFGGKAPKQRDDSEAPAPLSQSVLKAKEPAVRCFGEKLMSYIYSKVWNHRNTGLKKLQSNWEDNHFQRNEKTAFKLTVEIANEALQDRVATVVTTGTEIITYLWESHSGCISADVSYKFMSTISDNLVKQLSSFNARVAQGCKNCLIYLGEQPKLGPKLIFTSLLKKMTGKKNARKGRKLEENAKLLGRKGEIIGKMLEQKLPKSISVTEIMGVVLKMLQHKDGKVREVGASLATELYDSHPHKVTPMLDCLNDFMKETLNQAFLERTGASNVLERAEPSQKEQNRPSKTMAQVFTNDKVNRKKKKTKKKTRRKKAAPKPVVEPKQEEFHEPEIENDYDDEVTDRCNFCGLQDPAFAEDEKNLDFHFWQCPMLVECNHCSQLIDIPSLWAHLLDECEEAPKHQACPRCVQPIPVTKMEEHLHMEPQCRVAKPKDQANRCPLCLEDIEPNEEGWNYHILIDRCQQNQEAQ